MKTNTKRGGQASTPQTVTAPIKLKVGCQTIAITTTNQKISAHAGQVTLAGFFRSLGVREFLARVLPQRPTSPNALAPVEPTAIEGVVVADEIHTSRSASRPRRLVLLRRRTDAKGRGGGKMLLDCPGYKYQALLTNLPPSVAAVDVWRDYNGRASLENVIRELKGGFGLGGFCCQKFFATEAALSLAVWTYNLVKLFSHHLGLLATATISTLRHRLFHCADIISRCQNQTTLKLGLPPPLRACWQSVWTRILTPFSNCVAVESLTSNKPQKMSRQLHRYG